MSPDHSEIYAAARKHSTQGREMLPRFHPACFPWKTILIHMMITESPCPIKAARRWSSVMSRSRILSPCGSLSLDAQTAYCPLQRFLHRLFYRREPTCVKPDSSQIGYKLSHNRFNDRLISHRNLMHASTFLFIEIIAEHISCLQPEIIQIL